MKTFFDSDDLTAADIHRKPAKFTGRPCAAVYALPTQKPTVVRMYNSANTLIILNIWAFCLCFH